MFSVPNASIVQSGAGVRITSLYTLPQLEPVTTRFRSWVARKPDAPLISERAGDSWRSRSYGEADRISASLSSALLQMDLGQHRVLMIAASPSIDHALLRLAALRARIPFVALSPALFHHQAGARLAMLRESVEPGLIIVSRDCMDAFSDIAWTGSVPLMPLGEDAFERMKKSPVSPRSSEAEAALALDDLAAVFLTSGSTGLPKMVMVTHRMIAANQAGYAAVWPWLENEDLVLLDWLPWHHTFGGNDNLHKAIWHGGHYAIDDGRPDTPAGLSRMAENIASIRPTLHINVPKGIEGLLMLLESDPSFFDRFFSRMRVIFFAGAGLSGALWLRLRAMVSEAQRHVDHEIALVTGYGSTETGSTVSLVHFPIDRPDIIGLPLPGLELKLVPAGDKQELLVKGANVTPGYWKAPEASAAAFDEEGFFRTGDALQIVESSVGPVLSFDGRIGEDFKLTNGSWVSVGPLRLRLLAAFSEHGVPVSDILIGSDNDVLGAVAIASVAPDPGRFLQAVEAHNRNNPAATTFIARATVDPSPLSFAAGEVSEKGYPNMRVALNNRVMLTERLFAPVPPAGVLHFKRPQKV